MKFVIQIADDETAPAALSMTMLLIVPGADGFVRGEFCESRLTTAPLPPDLDAGPDSDQLGEDLLGLVAPAGSVERQVWDLAREVALAEVAGNTPEDAFEVILDIRSPRARRLPWELIGDGRWQPFRSDRVVAARGAWPPVQTPPEPPPLPVHVLVLVGDVTDALSDAELAAVYRGLDGSSCAWYVRYLCQPTLEEFRNEYARATPHVLHVLGNNVAGDDGLAVPIRSADVEEPWQFDLDVVYGLGNTAARAPRVVVLNGSHTACAIAVDELIKAGSSAVIAMGGRVDHGVNCEFVAKLYERVMEGDRIGRAVTEARNGLRRPSLGAAWARPRLTVAASPSQIVDFGHDRLDHVAAAGQPPFRRMAKLVDRTSDRLRLNEVLAGKERLIAVSGAEAGRADVAMSCFLTAAANGVRVAYVSLLGEDITDARFHALVQDGVRRWMPKPGVIAPPSLNLDLEGLDQPVRLRDETGFEKALTCLRRASGGPPVVLFLDSPSAVIDGASFREEFIDGLFDPDPVTVRVVLVDTWDWFADCGIDGYEHVMVERLRRSNCVAIAREYMSRHERPSLSRSTGDELKDWHARWGRVSNGLLEWAAKQAAPTPTDPDGVYFELSDLQNEARGHLKQSGFSPFLLGCG